MMNSSSRDTISSFIPTPSMDGTVSSFIPTPSGADTISSFVPSSVDVASKESGTNSHNDDSVHTISISSFHGSLSLEKGTGDFDEACVNSPLNVSFSTIKDEVPNIQDSSEEYHLSNGDIESIDKKRFRVDRRHSSYGRRRRKFLLGDAQLKEAYNCLCCNNVCLRKFGMHKLRLLRSHYLGLNREEQDVYLRTALSPDVKKQFEYCLGGSVVCRKAFKIAHSMGNNRLCRVQQRYLKNPRFLNPRYSRLVGPVGNLAISWMDGYFSLHAEVMPTTGKCHLTDNYTRREVYSIYRDEMLTSEEKVTSYSHFTRLWKHYFNNVSIPRKVRMGVCSICANLKYKRRHDTNALERREINDALKFHREQQAEERKKFTKHRRKCLRDPKKYMGMVIDGMDQKKTNLPHFVRNPKDIKEDTYVQMHVVGCLVFNMKLDARVFLSYPNVPNDANLTISIIHTVISNWGSELPQVLYVQLDNTCRENKNQILIAYLSMLVDKGVFVKIKLGFLLVGHTHDQIDQMFSTFSKKLARQDAVTLPKMMDVLKDAYTPHPNVSQISELLDFRKFVKGNTREESCINDLHDHSRQHQFLIKKDDHGSTLLFGKQMSSSPDWLPMNGLRFLKCTPSRVISAVLQEPLITFDGKHKAEKRGTSIDYMTCIAEKKGLISKAKAYFGSQDDLWWDEFFKDQESILKKFEEKDCNLKEPFVWPKYGSRMANNEFLTCNDEMHALINSPEREMYVGTYRSRERHHEMTDVWNGCIQDIKAGTMVVTLAENDPQGHLFWVAQVVDVSRSENDEIDSINVHWFRTKHYDAYKGKYTAEFTTNAYGKRKRSKAKTKPNTSELNLQEVDILVYDFTLTSTGHLRRKTINIIKQRVPTKQMAGDGSLSRKTRAQMEAHLGLHRDEDNVIIDSLEEDGSSTSSPSENNDVDSSNLKGVDTEEDCME